MQEPAPVPSGEPRRGFLKKFIALLAGSVAILLPSGAGIAVLLDPLRRKSKTTDWVRITTLDAVPIDGSPVRFPVIADQTNAWSKISGTTIGAVYLQRDGANVIAYNIHCPHAGCFVDAIPGGGFQCPCHGSRFNADGSLAAGVSPRPLDRLEIDPVALKENIVRIRYQNFAAGTSERTARS